MVANKDKTEKARRKIALPLTSVGSGRVRSIFCGSGQVGSVIYGLGLNLENFPWKCQIFQFFSLRVGSKSTWVKGLLFTVGQK